MELGSVIPFSAFNAAILALLLADLLSFHRRPRALRIREALLASAFWVGLALAFGLLVHPMYTQGWFRLGRGHGDHLLLHASPAEGLGCPVPG